MKKILVLLSMLLLACPVWAAEIKMLEDNFFIYTIEQRFTVFDNNQLKYRLNLISKTAQNSYLEVDIFQYITNYNISVYSFSEIDKNGNNVFANTKKYELEKILQPKGEMLAKKILELPRKCTRGSDQQTFFCTIYK